MIIFLSENLQQNCIAVMDAAVYGVRGELNLTGTILSTTAQLVKVFSSIIDMNVA